MERRRIWAAAFLLSCFAHMAAFWLLPWLFSWVLAMDGHQWGSRGTRSIVYVSDASLGYLVLTDAPTGSSLPSLAAPQANQAEEPEPSLQPVAPPPPTSTPQPSARPQPTPSSHFTLHPQDPPSVERVRVNVTVAGPTPRPTPGALRPQVNPPIADTPTDPLLPQTSQSHAQPSLPASASHPQPESAVSPRLTTQPQPETFHTSSLHGEALSESDTYAETDSGPQAQEPPVSSQPGIEEPATERVLEVTQAHGQVTVASSAEATPSVPPLKIAPAPIVADETFAPESEEAGAKAPALEPGTESIATPAEVTVEDSITEPYVEPGAQVVEQSGDETIESVEAPVEEPPIEPLEERLSKLAPVSTESVDPVRADPGPAITAPEILEGAAAFEDLNLAKPSSVVQAESPEISQRAVSSGGTITVGHVEIMVDTADPGGSEDDDALQAAAFSPASPPAPAADSSPQTSPSPEGNIHIDEQFGNRTGIPTPPGAGVHAETVQGEAEQEEAIVEEESADDSPGIRTDADTDRDATAGAQPLAYLEGAAPTAGAQDAAEAPLDPGEDTPTDRPLPIALDLVAARSPLLPQIPGSSGSSLGIRTLPFQTSPSESPPVDAEDEQGRHDVPHVVKSVAPVYPDKARQAGIEGRVHVAVDVGADGIPLATAIQRSSGNAELDAAALDAVMMWRFSPAVKDGVPVQERAVVEIVFHIDP